MLPVLGRNRVTQLGVTSCALAESPIFSHTSRT